MAKSASKKKSSAAQKGGGSVREQAAVVRRYLEALDKHKPKRGRKRTPDSIQRRLDAIETKLEEASPLQRLQLVQERMDLEAERERLKAATDLTELEDEFASVARGYGERKGISYAAWREMGVPPAVLKKADVPRTRRS